MEDYELDKLATKVLQKHVPNRYPRSNNLKNAMFDFARQYHEIQVKKCDLADVGKRYTQEDLDTAYDSGFNEGIANAM